MGAMAECRTATPISRSTSGLSSAVASDRPALRRKRWNIAGCSLAAMTLWETLVFLANLYGEVPGIVIVLAAVLPCAAQLLLAAGARGHAGNGISQVLIMLFVFLALRAASVFS